MQGVLITFEGPDGAGKTTQLRLLAEWLAAQGLPVTVTREPGGTALGDAIRSLLLDHTYKTMDARTEALLYAAARAQHVAELIRPALYLGHIVLSDRYADSTVVYQGAARKLDPGDLIKLNRFATAGVKPELTILLDCDVTLLKQRLDGRGEPDRIEQEGAAFQEQVRQGFLTLAREEPDRFRVVAAAGGIEAIHAAIVAVCEEFLARRSLV